MRVLIAASEAYPFAKTGGLADVAGALNKELAALGLDVSLMLPLYKSIEDRFDLSYTGREIRVPVGGKVYLSRIFSHGKGRGQAFFIECGEFFDRAELYGTAAGAYEDNAERFVFFSRAVLEACDALGLRPDVIHANDWQTGLIPVYLKTLYKEKFKYASSLITIHNLGYQGVFPADAFSATGLPSELFTMSGMEFWGKVNFLKAGIVFADAVSTVSPNYAREILTPEYGFGLDGVLKGRARDLKGIINGIDTEVWDPSNDTTIPEKYSSKDLSGKAACKERLIKECGLSGRRPLIAMVGRISSQKGIELLIEAGPRLIEEGASLTVLGAGEAALEKKLSDLSGKFKKYMSLNIGYDEAFAHRVYAGADIILIPSKYEPCGLTQLIAQRYGTVPVARRTGGLADTIEDCSYVKAKGTGFLFSDYSADALSGAAGRALYAYSDPAKWKAVVLSGMKKDFSWRASAGMYGSLYESLTRGAKR